MGNKRHAYAIIAHTDKKCLEVLLSLLDDYRNDIFILIDKKSDKNLEEGLICKKSKLTIIDKSKRVDIRWGDISQIKAELTLFENILSTKNEYAYVHLLSGQDLPLKDQDTIHNFFGSYPEDSNFIEYSEGEWNEEIIQRVNGYNYIFTGHQRLVGNKLIGIPRLYLIRVLRHSFLLIQKIFRYKKKWPFKLYRGTNWVSLSLKSVKYLVDKKEEILKQFKRTIIPDETYKHTYLKLGGFDATIRSRSLGNSPGLRLMDWGRGNDKGNPHTWTIADWEELSHAKEIFARKFSSDLDYEVINKIKEMISKEEKVNRR